MWSLKSLPAYESHAVETADGYSLTLLRVPTIDGHLNDKPPVLIVHGLISSGTHWFMNTPQQDLPHTLASLGYDCWIANLRGTPLARAHKKINPDANPTKFWDFSWHEMGKFDMPAMIDYILALTGQKKISYIGHSMGCAVFFAAMAINPSYNSKIEVMIALGPSVYGKHIRNKLARLSVPVGTFLGKLRSVYSREIFPMTLIAYAKKFLPYLTLNPERVGCWILRTFGKHTGVLGHDQIEKSRMLHIAGELPSPTSLKTFCHGTQCFSSGRFQQYDYGKIENFLRYGEPIPPIYSLSLTTAPVATFYSAGDQLCTAKDVSRLANELPNLIGNYCIQHDQFAHTDFMFGKDASRLVYDKILEIFSSQELKNMS